MEITLQSPKLHMCVSKFSWQSRRLDLRLFWTHQGLRSLRKYDNTKSLNMTSIEIRNKLLFFKPRERGLQVVPGWNEANLKPKDSTITVKILKVIDLHPLPPQLQSNKHTCPTKRHACSMAFPMLRSDQSQEGKKTVQITVIGSDQDLPVFSYINSFDDSRRQRRMSEMLKWHVRSKVKSPWEKCCQCLVGVE